MSHTHGALPLIARALAVLGALAPLACGGTLRVPAGATAAPPLAPPGGRPEGTLVAQVAGELPISAATRPAAARPARELLVVEAWVRLQVDDVRGAANVIRGHVSALGGRLVSEELGGAPESWYGTMVVRVPPERLTELLAFVEARGSIENRRVAASDVTREYVDREIALGNLRVTMRRLEELMGRPGIGMADVLALEQEMTRIRGEIERLEGAQRFARDQVGFASVTVNVVRRRGAVFAPNAKFHPGARLATLTLLDPEGRQGTRLGGGAVLHVGRFYTLDLDVFPSVEAEGRTVLATAGGGTYSDFLGRGERRFLNPWLGLRVGYGYLSSAHHAVAGAEAGVELLKHRWVLVDAAARVLGLFGEDEQTAVLEGALTVQVPF